MNYIERCLYDYLENVVKLYILKMELSCLMSVHGQNYNLHSGNGMSNPVLELTSRLMLLERKINQTEQHIKAVRRLKSELIGSDIRVQQMLSILRLRYFNHMQHNKVMRVMAVSRNTYWRRHNELLQKARKYLDEVK